MSDELRDRMRDDRELMMQLRMYSGKESVAQEQIDRFTELARAAAERHFANTEVVDIELTSVGPSGFEIDENDNVIVTNHQFSFNATDSTGRVAWMLFDGATERFLGLSTSFNDIIPGWRYEQRIRNIYDEDGNVQGAETVEGETVTVRGRG